MKLYLQVLTDISNHLDFSSSTSSLDAHFPSSSTAKSSTCGTLEIRADGCASLVELLEAIVKFFPLDQYDETPVSITVRCFVK